LFKTNCAVSSPTSQRESSKRIIEMLGGRIWFESLAGQGSTFAFTLPVIVERQVEAA
jgi:signal transduction histidine kinase